MGRHRRWILVSVFAPLDGFFQQPPPGVGIIGAIVAAGLLSSALG
jgi:hypothetical protein